MLHPNTFILNRATYSILKNNILAKQHYQQIQGGMLRP